MLFYDNGRVESFSNAEYPYKECAIIGSRECAKFVEIIDECKYKYVLELFEMWNDKYAKKENGYSFLGFGALSRPILH